MSTPDSLLIENLTVRYGALEAVKDVTVEFAAGSVVGIIGPNGAGKTTLLNAISGFTHISGGRIGIGDTDLTRTSAQKRVRQGIVRNFQTVRLMERETVFDNVAVGCERFAQPTAIEQMLSLPRQVAARARDMQATWAIISALGLEAYANRAVSELPYATRRLTELARTLVVAPKFLLLDEPAAGLDRTERVELATMLGNLHDETKFTMVVIEHDVDVVRRMCTSAIALDYGRVIAVGTPEAVLQDPQVHVAYFGEGRSA